MTKETYNSNLVITESPYLRHINKDKQPSLLYIPSRQVFLFFINELDNMDALSLGKLKMIF